jgi:NhaP-type Na+/H+ or K+/H+ antiporter
LSEHVPFVIAAVFLTAMACQWLAWRVKLPAIIFLLLAGIWAGPLSHWLVPDALLGRLLFPFVSLSVAIILFEGSLTLKFQEIVGLQRVVQNLVTIGMLVTWGVTTIATRVLLEFSWEISFLFGAVMVVSGPTVILPMLRTVRPKATVASILRWEGILIDPIGATVAVLVYEFIISGGGRPGLSTWLTGFGEIIVIGASLGASAGYLFGVVLRRHWLPTYLHNLATLTLVIAVFVFSNHLHEESGLLSVTVMGIWLANMKWVDVEEILHFKESLSMILISILFIVLAARITFAELFELGVGALLVLGVIQFLARPLTVMVSTAGTGMSWSERHLLAWIAPRGIVAAAVSALFAIKLDSLGYADARLLVPMTFMVIVGTVVLQSATARPIATWLKVAEPDPKGFLIIGANAVARAVAKELIEAGFQSRLVSTSWSNIMEARMEGLPTYYGNPISEHAEQHLDLVGIGRLLALTPNGDQNALSTLHYRMEFGPDAVYAVQTGREKGRTEKMKAALRRRGRTLFGPKVTYSMLASILARGGDIKTTKLTEKFSLDDFRATHQGKMIPLFAIDPKGRIHVYTAEQSLDPGAGWTLLGLVEKKDD